MEDCIFCKIVSGEIPATKLYENEKVLSFLDIYPAAKGHALVIPKKHCKTLIDVPHEDLKEVALVVQKIGAAIMKALDCEGFNVIQSNHESAGQVIPHVHFHIVPRNPSDGLEMKWGKKEQDRKELEEYAKKITGHL